MPDIAYVNLVILLLTLVVIHVINNVGLVVAQKGGIVLLVSLDLCLKMGNAIVLSSSLVLMKLVLHIL